MAARTRILNNKGQSVLSLASSHLSPDVIAAVEAAEAHEGELEAAVEAAWQQRLAKLGSSDRPLVRSGGWLARMHRSKTATVVTVVVMPSIDPCTAGLPRES